MKCIKNFFARFKKKPVVIVEKIPELPPEPDVSINLNEILAKEAQKWIGTVEVGGDNMGPDVEKFQKAVDGKASLEPWCMCAVQYWIHLVEERFLARSPIYETEHVYTCWNKTPVEQRLKIPEVGCLMLWNYKGTTSGHVGVVVEVMLDGYRVETVEGNTGPGRGIVREGDGVYRKSRSINGGSKFIVLGFLKPF